MKGDDLRNAAPDMLLAEQAAEEIAELTRVVRGLRERMEEGERQMRDVVPAVAASLDRLENGARGAAELAEEIAGAVREELDRTAAGNEEWQAAHEQLDEQIDALADTLAGLEDRIGSIATEANALRQALDETMAGASAAVDEMKEQIAEAEGALAESLEDATESLGEFVDAFTDQLGETEEAIEALMEATVDDVREHLVEAMQTAVSTATQSLDELAQRIADQMVPAAAQEVAVELVSDLKAVVDDLLAGFREIVGQLRQTLFEGADETGQSRQAVEAALDQMQVLLDPIQTEIGRIRDLASMVGIGI